MRCSRYAAQITIPIFQTKQLYINNLTETHLMLHFANANHAQKHHGNCCKVITFHIIGIAPQLMFQITTIFDIPLLLINEMLLNRVSGPDRSR